MLDANRDSGMEARVYKDTEVIKLNEIHEAQVKQNENIQRAQALRKKATSGIKSSWSNLTKRVSSWAKRGKEGAVNLVDNTIAKGLGAYDETKAGLVDARAGAEQMKADLKEVAQLGTEAGKEVVNKVVDKAAEVAKKSAEVGLEMIQNFGEATADTFEEILSVMEKLQNKFDSWRLNASKQKAIKSQIKLMKAQNKFQKLAAAQFKKRETI